MAATTTTILMMLMIVLLKTRSVWVGLVPGSLAAMLCLAVFVKQMNLPVVWRRYILTAILAGLAGVAALVWVGRNANEQSVAGMVHAIFDTSSPHIIHRIIVWKSNVDMFSEHALASK